MSIRDRARTLRKVIEGMAAGLTDTYSIGAKVSHNDKHWVSSVDGNVWEPGVYGGTVDVTNGVLKSRPYYASYNGETLVGPWVSSMDAYTPGGTPTIGAQVVDLGGAETEYTLTPAELTTLLGQNNIFADCGPVSVEYRADTKLYIKRLTGPTDDDMTADANIASGTYFMVGNNLFLSTASIAAGEAIVPGTNCTATNPAAALNALNS